MSVFKIKYMTAPGVGHVYCRVFAAPRADAPYAALGNLTVAKQEWEDFKLACVGFSFEAVDLDRSFFTQP